MLTKLPNIPPSFLLQMMLNSNVMFCTSFSSLDDIVDDEIWQNACNRLHGQLKKWLKEQADKEVNDEGS